MRDWGALLSNMSGLSVSSGWLTLLADGERKSPDWGKYDQEVEAEPTDEVSEPG